MPIPVLLLTGFNRVVIQDTWCDSCELPEYILLVYVRGLIRRSTCSVVTRNASESVIDSSLHVDSQPKLGGLVWGSAATWRCSTFIKWTEWTLAMTCSHDDSIMNIFLVIDGLAVLFLLQNSFFGPCTAKSQPIWIILHTPIVVRNTLVGRLRLQSAHERLQAKPKRLCFLFVILVTLPKSYIETTDRRDFHGKPSEWRWGRMLLWIFFGIL